MEYSADNGNTWYECSAENTIVSSSGNYLVRNKKADDLVTPVNSGGMYVLMDTTSNMEFSVDGGNVWNACSDGMTAVGTSEQCLVRTKGASYKADTQ